jgi:hypothetical protein
MARAFTIKTGSGEHRRNLSVNVYLLMQNVLDMRNIINVFTYTGSPTDDGYLTSAVGKQAIADKGAAAQAYIDQYTAMLLMANYGLGRANGNYSYSLPRMTRLGVQVNF